MAKSNVTRSPSSASSPMSRPTPLQSTHRVISRDYTAIARATKERVSWAALLRDPRWKWFESVGDFSVYTSGREPDDAASDSFGVLAVGVVKGSVREIAALLASSSQQEYDQKMTAIYGKEFKHGAYVADVDQDGSDKEARGTSLSIRSATFPGPGWLRRDEDWCFLDATTFDHAHQLFEKLMTSLKLEDTLPPGDIRKAKLGGGKSFHNVVCGYSVLPEGAAEGIDPNIERARVHFFAEFAPPPPSEARGFGRFHSRKQDASLSLVVPRLLSMARNCERLPALVRRRRLGVQILMDARRVLSLSNRKCINCVKSQRLAKLCRVCGNAVCRDCSNKYERETYKPHSTTPRIDLVRVCHPCLAHIEKADFSNVTHRSLFGPTVFPEPVDEYGSTRRNPRDLKSLLHDALLSAPSPQRKDALISVIRCVLDQEEGGFQRPRIQSTLSTTTAASSEQECIAALDRFTLQSTPTASAEMSGRDGRAYTLDPRNLTSHPTPENESERLQAIEKLGVLTHGDWDELDIICDLAAKEVGAFASIVSVITEDQQRVIAANNPHFRAMNASREDSFCSHTIMDNKPLVVPHPEADFRLSHIARKWNLGVQFYCGFPLMAEDNTVIGTLCCVDRQTHELTESQYSAMQRLAQTATKIIRVEAKKRRRTVAT